MKASIFIALFALGCGGASPRAADPASPPSTAPASCDDVVAHVRQLSLTASGATTPAQADEAARDIEPALTELRDECEAPPPAGWSATFRSCVMGAKSRDDVEACDRANAPPAEADTHEE